MAIFHTNPRYVLKSKYRATINKEFNLVGDTLDDCIKQVVKKKGIDFASSITDYKLLETQRVYGILGKEGILEYFKCFPSNVRDVFNTIAKGEYTLVEILNPTQDITIKKDRDFT